MWRGQQRRRLQEPWRRRNNMRWHNNIRRRCRTTGTSIMKAMSLRHFNRGRSRSLMSATRSQPWRKGLRQGPERSGVKPWPWTTGADDSTCGENTSDGDKGAGRESNAHHAPPSPFRGNVPPRAAGVGGANIGITGGGCSVRTALPYPTRSCCPENVSSFPSFRG